VLIDDYLMANTDLSFATISHEVSIHVEKIEPDGVRISIARNTPAVEAMVECYKTAPDVFNGFVKDYVREHIYPHIRDYVPSSTKEGRDALYRRLKENKELFRYEVSESGDLESLLAEYLSGKTNLGEVLRASTGRVSSQTQIVRSDQIGTFEEELPDIIGDVPPADDSIKYGEFDASPPILRPEIPSRMKILTVAGKYEQLNNFQMFLGLSDRLFRTEGEFLRWPHTTKIIWAVHRVIYIFTDATGGLSLYYDIELKEPLETIAGGSVLRTTTIITENRIYVPVPHDLESAFHIEEGTKEFYVRFDTIP